MTTDKPSLTRIILNDLWQHKGLLVLGLAVVITAFAVIWSAQESRRLTAQWNNLLQERDHLDVHWRHLLLEEQTLAEHSRIDRLARNQLEMNRPNPAQERVVRLP
ncbi:cell division protein FtsL [Ferrimonas marina]|uniref:Cell division protein FtsL n=1 Tax=Ferrimonas marina TaxID=299255 RepID=A0A1M5XG60_9GAMM|nr:cell division protein FtsL [Ferrimonas marina]SHH98729.1 cell division protein FtsL [Ferrimonas marina]